jgi:hypothetical protein
VTGPILYVTAWNDMTRKPLGGGHRWLDVDEARGRYDVSHERIEVVEASRRDHLDRPVPAWTIYLRRDVGARVQFYTDAGSTWRLIDYDLIDGRLWRSVTADYIYADDDRRHDFFEATQKVTSKFGPDGTGTIDIDDKSEPEVARARLSDAPVSGFWLDWPPFGQWDELSDPEYGIPSDPNPGLPA